MNWTKAIVVLAIAASGCSAATTGTPTGAGSTGASSGSGAPSASGSATSAARSGASAGTSSGNPSTGAGMSGSAIGQTSSGASNPGDAGPSGTDSGSGVGIEAGTPDPNLHFDTTISQVVLERYLSRSISFTQLLQDDITKPLNSMGVDPRDNMRMLLDSKAKFIGRSVFLWGTETNLPAFLATAQPFAALLHQADPDMILQAGEFEIVTTDVEKIAVPDWVFTEFSQPVVVRNFDYTKMLFPAGKFVDNWGTGASVPDMSQLETRMWFYYLAKNYIDVGIEAIHFGQVSLMDQNDPGHVGWFDMLGRVRAYANQNARRHMLLADAHTPTGGIVENGKLLFDSHAFPLRIAPVSNMPFQGELEVGYADSIYGRSKGGITPSGWSVASLPYMVEFDNFGSDNPGHASSSPFIWGWDEITWFATQAEADRNAWLEYAYQWVPAHDPVGHVEMPGSRVLSPGSGGGPTWYWANTKSAACPTGFNTEATITALWAGGSDAGM